MRVAIVGAGGVGGYFGSRWARAGIDVTFLARGAHLETLRTKGLRLISPLGDDHVVVSAEENAAEVGEVDLIILATKSWQLPEAVEGLSPMVGPETAVVGLQNGVEAAAVLSNVLPGAQVLGGTCRIISFIEAPGVIRHAGIEPTVFLGDLSGTRRGLAAPIVEQLQGVEGVSLHLAPDVEAEIWRKFLFFAPVSGVGSVTQVPIGVFRRLPETRELLEGAMQEVYDLAGALGVRLPSSSVADALAFVDAAPADGTSSMQRDFRDRRPTELDELSGAVVRRGGRAGVDVPIHSMLFASLLPRHMEAHGTLEFSNP